MIDSWHTRSTNNLASCQISITNFKFWDGNKFLQVNSKYSIVRARFIFFLELLVATGYQVTSYRFKKVSVSYSTIISTYLSLGENVENASV